jgi:hypothetical protein
MMSIGSLSNSFSTTATSSADRPHGMRGLMKSGMDAAAKALNMDSSTLMDQLKSGKSLKDVAAAQGVDFSKVQSAMKDAIKPQLDSAVQSGELSSSEADDLLSKLTSGDRPQGPPPGMGQRGPRGGGDAMKKALEAASQTLGMSDTDLLNSLESGQSLQDVAKSKGVDWSKVDTAIKDSLKSQSQDGGDWASYSVSGVASSADSAGTLFDADA